MFYGSSSLILFLSPRKSNTVFLFSCLLFSRDLLFFSLIRFLSFRFCPILMFSFLYAVSPPVYAGIFIYALYASSTMDAPAFVTSFRPLPRPTVFIRDVVSPFFFFLIFFLLLRCQIFARYSYTLSFIVPRCYLHSSPPLARLFVHAVSSGDPPGPF